MFSRTAFRCGEDISVVAGHGRRVSTAAAGPSQPEASGVAGESFLLKHETLVRNRSRRVPESEHAPAGRSAATVSVYDHCAHLLLFSRAQPDDIVATRKGVPKHGQPCWMNDGSYQLLQARNTISRSKQRIEPRTGISHARQHIAYDKLVEFTGRRMGSGARCGSASLFGGDKREIWSARRRSVRPRTPPCQEISSLPCATGFWRGVLGQ